jgi:hypothetical protein
VIRRKVHILVGHSLPYSSLSRAKLSASSSFYRNSSPARPQEQWKRLEWEEDACFQIKSSPWVRWQVCRRLSWEEEEVTDTSVAGSLLATSLDGIPGNKEQCKAQSFDCTYSHPTPSVGARQLYLLAAPLFAPGPSMSCFRNFMHVGSLGYYLADKIQPDVYGMHTFHFCECLLQRPRAIP